MIIPVSKATRKAIARSVARSEREERAKRRPTERQIYLMNYMGPGHSFVRLSSYGTPNIIRSVEYMRDSSCRNPSRREIDALVEAGWAVLRHDPNSCTTNTQTNETKYGHRACLTKEGEECLSRVPSRAK